MTYNVKTHTHQHTVVLCIKTMCDGGFLYSKSKILIFLKSKNLEKKLQTFDVDF